MINETTGRDEVKAAEDKYQEVLAWEASFAKEIENLKKADQNKKVTYAQKAEGARYVPTVVGFKNLGKLYRIWDRQTQKHIGTTYTSKRACQNEIDDMKS